MNLIFCPTLTILSYQWSSDHHHVMKIKNAVVKDLHFRLNLSKVLINLLLKACAPMQCDVWVAKIKTPFLFILVTQETKMQCEWGLFVPTVVRTYCCSGNFLWKSLWKFNLLSHRKREGHLKLLLQRTSILHSVK